MAKLTAKQLKAMPDSMFGLPKTRQYPMPDKAHVIKAIQFFKYCPDKDKPELAKNINRRAKELKMQIKVQPSSAFYKYADKSILKEAMMVQEFHIGQLSPIVTLKPQVIKMNFGNGKMDDNNGPLERLQRLWSSNKSNDVKAQETANIVSEAVNNGAKIDAVTYGKINDIDMMWYMQNRWGNESKNINYSERLNMRMNGLYMDLQDAIKSHDVEVIIKIINNTSGTIYACALALVNYTTDLTDNEKAYINSHASIKTDASNPLTSIAFPKADETRLTPSSSETNYIYRMDDDDVYIVDSFINMLPDPCLLGAALHKLAALKFPDHTIYDGCIIKITEPNTEDIYRQMDVLGFARGNTDYGYYRKYITGCSYDFLQMGQRGNIYAVASVFPGTTNDKNRHMFMLLIHDRLNAEYNNLVLTHVLGSKEPCKIIARTVDVNLHKTALEATDFKALYNGIQISKNGNVSFILDELQPWQDKYNLCKNMMERNMKDTEYEQYKNNLCALYSMINVIYNKYNPSLADDSQEAKSALGVMDKAMTLFKDGIGAITKVQPEFNFINYYMSTHYNDKLSVFKSLDDKELRDEATIAYGWIMK